MDRVNKILNDSKYRQCLLQIQNAEANRIFCRHTIAHFLDVARITYILCLEKGIKVDKEIIYAIGLLHDIGRCYQYTEGIEHHTASVNIAKEILPECDFTNSEIKTILKAIKNHRSNDSSDILSQLVYIADKKSRNCFNCNARIQCNWSEDKINNGVEI